jgi:glycosyltransferase involved in cell wall biosynthesis
MTKPIVLMLSQEVHPIPPLKGAAVEQWIDAVAHGMSDFVPHIVSVVHPILPDAEVVGGVHYHRVRIGRVYNRVFRKLTRIDPYPYIQRIVSYANAIRPAIIHIQNAPQFVSRLRAGVKDARLLLHMQNEKPVEGLPPVDAFCGCSKYITRWYRDNGLQARAFAELPNGVDISRFRPRWENTLAQAAAQSRFGVPQDRFVVLYVGRISPEKGPDLLVDAMRHLDSRRFHLVLAGEWSTGDARKSQRVAYGNALRARLEGISVTVLGHFAPEAMADIYQVGDLLVMPSKFEDPNPMVPLEAMASGVPVLALRKGGMAEYMLDRENALVLPPDTDSTGLAAAIASADRESAAFDSITRAARALVEDRFSWTNVVRETQDVYRGMLQ